MVRRILQESQTLYGIMLYIWWKGGVIIVISILQMETPRGT